MSHIELSRDRDLILVAPASANFLARIALGLADDLLSTLVLARHCGLMVAPAMNVEMWDNRATQRNLATLRADGVAFAGPAEGDQACGETGMGRMLEPEQILAEVEAWFAPKLLAGKHVLVTAGPTEEAIDPVRVITNSSSGKMGFAVARAAREAGASVTLISGPVALAAPEGVTRVNVRSAQQMFNEVKAAVDGSDIFIAVAAVADWRIKKPFDKKVKKSAGRAPVLEFEENPDILAWVASRRNPPFCVGFAAESEKVAANARAKRVKKGVPLIAANLAQAALGADDNAITLFDARGSHSLGRGPKIELARKLVAHVAGMLSKAKR
jgi:phosphopantothenoylcysteine decarboxylase/phosphopantothenate--cysteine ligase